MAPWLLALITGQRKLVTQTFTSNTTFTVPFGVSNLETVSGYGAAGSPSSYNGDVSRSAIVTYVHGIASATVYSTAGDISWNSVQGEAVGAGAAISSTPSGGTYGGSDYVYNPTTHSYSYSLTFVSWSNAIPGSASVSNSAGWKSSGAIVDGDYGTSSVNWLEYGTTTPATTGASATGFGKTFPGGTGGPATTTSFANVAVTGGSNYSIVVPAGGSLTISYYR
jgi:hypothetical protein